MRMQARNAMRIYVDKPQTTKTVFAADLNLAGSVIKKLAVLKISSCKTLQANTVVVVVPLTVGFCGQVP